MNAVFEPIALVVMLFAAITIYAVIMKNLFPTLFLKVRYSVGGDFGRGLKRFKSQNGRAVLYEPGPSIRKYIHSYALYTNGGYKYLRCKLDERIRTVSYAVVMYNNKNRVIDSIEISERIGDTPSTKDLLLHQNTSYVALILRSVNEQEITSRKYMHYRVFDLVLYYVFVSLFSFGFILLGAFFINALVEMLFSSKTMLLDDILHYVLGSLFVGFVCTWLFVLNGKKNGIVVRFNGRK